jgi:hypothetical protein
VGGPAPVGVSPALAGWLQGLMWAAAALSALVALAYWATWSAFERWLRAGMLAEGRTWQGWSDAERTALALGVARGAVLVAQFGVLVVWAHRAHGASDRLEPQGRSWSSGWAVAAWFVPLGSVVLAKAVLNEIERIALAPRRRGRVSPLWRTHPLSSAGTVWWTAFWAYVVFHGVGGLVMPTDAATWDAGSVKASYALALAGSLCGVVSMVAGVVHLREVSRRLSPASLDDLTLEEAEPAVRRPHPLPGTRPEDLLAAIDGVIGPGGTGRRAGHGPVRRGARHPGGPRPSPVPTRRRSPAAPPPAPAPPG